MSPSSRVPRRVHVGDGALLLGRRGCPAPSVCDVAGPRSCELAADVVDRSRRRSRPRSTSTVVRSLGGVSDGSLVVGAATLVGARLAARRSARRAVARVEQHDQRRSPRSRPGRAAARATEPRPGARRSGRRPARWTVVGGVRHRAGAAVTWVAGRSGAAAAAAAGPTARVAQRGGERARRRRTARPGPSPAPGVRRPPGRRARRRAAAGTGSRRCASAVATGLSRDERPAAGEALEGTTPERVDVAGAGWPARPAACSGERYCGVPITWPVWVSADALGGAGDAEVGDLHLPSGVTSRLAGFTSRCTMPAACAAASAVGGLGQQVAGLLGVDRLARPEQRRRAAGRRPAPSPGRAGDPDPSVDAASPKSKTAAMPGWCSAGGVPGLGREAGAERRVVGVLGLEQLDRDLAAEERCRCARHTSPMPPVAIRESRR